jgi:hypothetical protein
MNDNLLYGGIEECGLWSGLHWRFLYMRLQELSLVGVGIGLS